jgi:hypothetical protein
MKFKVITLADITETNARRNEDSKGWRQQQNYNTFIGVLGLRINPIIDKSPTTTKRAISNIGFGKKYKGTHNVWECTFEVEYEGGLNLEMLNNDFDLIPFITDLEETVNINPSVFRTQDEQECNIIFKYVDNE